MKHSMENNDQLEAANLLAHEFELEVDTSYEKLLQYIKAEVDHLLANNFEKLLWICYRVDVSEKMIMAILEDLTITKPANTIAIKLLERQIQKIETRRSFSKPIDEDVDEDLKW